MIRYVLSSRIQILRLVVMQCVGVLLTHFLLGGISMLDEESKEFLESFKSFNRIYFLVTDAADSFPFIINSKNRTKNLLSGLKKL